VFLAMTFPINGLEGPCTRVKKIRERHGGRLVRIKFRGGLIKQL
jgi:hypothetical protein